MILLINPRRVPRAGEIARAATRILCAEGIEGSVRAAPRGTRYGLDDRWTFAERPPTRGGYEEARYAEGMALDAALRAMGLHGVEFAEPPRGPSYREMQGGARA